MPRPPLKTNPFELKHQSSLKKNKTLEWEESAMDSFSELKGEILDLDRTSPKAVWLLVLVFVCFGTILARMFFLQIINGKDFRALSENNRIRKQVMLAPRGLILDTNGENLVQNIASFNLVAVPLDIAKDNLDGQIKKMAELFDFDAEEARLKINKSDRMSIQQILIKQDLTKQQNILFETRASEFIGFSVQKVPIRQYIDAEVFSHILGYTGVISQNDFQKLDSGIYDNNDFVGKVGMEQVYEKYLHGRNGDNLVEVDATGKLLNVLGERPPKSGMTLVLNIDKGLQGKIYDELVKNTNSFNKRKAAAVALNPKNGQVLALVSLPGFDNNLFAHGIKKQDYQKLLNDASLPLYNRAISGTYPPGSTVKPMVGAAALQEKLISEHSTVVDRGVLVIPNQYDSKISYNFFGWKRDGLGPVDVKKAIAQSSDIFFYVVSGGHPSSVIKGLGAEKLAEYYKKFGLNKITGIDLPGENPGRIPDPVWKEAYYKDDKILSHWYLGDTYHIGIGQGDMLTTPLQVAFWTASIANNGVGFKPQVLKKVLGEKGEEIFKNTPQVLVERFIDIENLKIVQEGMRETVLSGSGKQLMALPISAAGKTGTSQFDGSDPKRTHAWFTAYAPYENPEIVITVLVEAGGEGHATAVPVVKETLKWWAENRHNK